MLPPQSTRPTLLPAKRSGRRAGREPRRTGALGHGALEGGVGGDRALDGRLLDEDDLCDEVAHDRQGPCAHGLDRDALGQGRPADRPFLAGKGVPERGIERRLDADDLDLRLQRLRRHGHAGDEPAAADRHDDRVEVRRVRQHFERDGALARHHRRVVVGVDEREALGRREPVRLLRRLDEGLAEQHTRAP